MTFSEVKFWKLPGERILFLYFGLYRNNPTYVKWSKNIQLNSELTFSKIIYVYGVKIIQES